MKNKNISFCIRLLIASFSIPVSISLAQEQITITTYYPAPFGIYRELRADQMAIGSNYRTTALANGRLIVEDRIGIGVTAPTHKFEANMGNNSNFFRVDTDNNIGVEMRSGSSGGTPYIDFSNDASSDYDFRIIMGGNDDLSVTGGRTTFSNDSGTPAIIRTGEVWYCANY